MSGSEERILFGYRPAPEDALPDWRWRAAAAACRATNGVTPVDACIDHGICPEWMPGRSLAWQRETLRSAVAEAIGHATRRDMVTGILVGGALTGDDSWAHRYGVTPLTDGCFRLLFMDVEGRRDDEGWIREYVYAPRLSIGGDDAREAIWGMIARALGMESLMNRIQPPLIAALDGRSPRYDREAVSRIETLSTLIRAKRPSPGEALRLVNLVLDGLGKEPAPPAEAETLAQGGISPDGDKKKAAGAPCFRETGMRDVDG